MLSLDDYLRERERHRAELCFLRSRAHYLFDFFWTTQESKKEARQSLAEAVGSEVRFCEMDEATLQSVIRALEKAKGLGYTKLRRGQKWELKRKN